MYLNEFQEPTSFTLRLPCPYCELEVIHLAGHLTLTHGLKPSDAKDLVEAASGKEAARTDLQWTAFTQQKTNANLIDDNE